MGVYNTINFKNKKGEEVSIQSKNGDTAMYSFEIGNQIELEDGIYFGLEGSLVVFQGRLVAAFDSEEQHLYDKWDRPLDYPDLHSVNPLAQAMNRLRHELDETKDTGVTT